MLFALVLNLNIGGDREVLLLNRLHIIIILELHVADLTYLSHSNFTSDSKSVLEVRWLRVHEQRRLVCHTWIDCRGRALHAADLAQMHATVVVTKMLILCIKIDVLLQGLFISNTHFYI